MSVKNQESNESIDVSFSIFELAIAMLSLAAKVNDPVDPVNIIKCELEDDFWDDGQAVSTSSCIKTEPLNEFTEGNGNSAIVSSEESNISSFETIVKQERLVEANLIPETSNSRSCQYNLRRISKPMGGLLDNNDSSNSDCSEDSQPSSPEHFSPKPSTHDLLDLKCEFCDKVYKTRKAYESHIMTIHVIDKEFQCSKCERAFISQEKLNSHMGYAHQRLKCSYCPATYRREKMLLEHMGKHNNTRECLYKCGTCGKGFVRHSHLTTHEMMSHTNKKPHKCDFCPKSFRLHARLLAHLANSHNVGEKRYKCPVCSKAFYLEGDLIRNHLPRHSDERNFSCDICSASFSTKNGLSRHTNSCHRDRKRTKT